MHHHKYKYKPKQHEKSPDVYIRSIGHPKIMSPPQSPRSRNNAPPFPRDQYYMQRERQYNISPRGRYATGSSLSKGEDRMKMLINEVLNSADAVAAELLRYDLSEPESLCSKYYLNREKLTSYLSSERNQYFEGIGSKLSKKTHTHRNKKRTQEDDIADDEVTPDLLARLEDIVYGKVIPILQTELDCERKMGENINKHKQYQQNDLKQGLVLLERLQNKKNSVGFDGYVQVLEKFIRRVMDKEESLMNKLFKLQDKLQKQIEKTQKLSKERERQNFKRQGRINSTGQNNTEEYQGFVRQIKVLLKENKPSSSTQQSLAVELDLLTARIKTIVNSYPQSQKQIRQSAKEKKEVHANCREEQKKSEDHIKTLKSVVKKLDAQVENLKQQCQSLGEKVITGADKLWKFEQRSSKIAQENDKLTAQFNSLNDEITYKNHLIGQYLDIIGKLEDHIKMKEQNQSLLEVQNENHVQNINMKNEGYERLLRHVSEIQERNKELEEGEEQKERQLQEARKQLYVKEFEATHIKSTHERVCKEYDAVKLNLKVKQEELAQLEEEIKLLKGPEYRQNKENRQMIMGLVSKESQTYESFDQSTPTFDIKSHEEIYRAVYPQVRDQLGLGIGNITSDQSQTMPIGREEIVIQAQSPKQKQIKQEKKEEKSEQGDIQMLKQTIKMLEQGLKNSHKQVQELSYQNKILLNHNEALYQANLPTYTKDFPLNKTVYQLAAYPVNIPHNPQQDEVEYNSRKQRPDFIPAQVNKEKITKDTVWKNLDEQAEPRSLAEEMNSAEQNGQLNQSPYINTQNISAVPVNDLQYNKEEEQQARRATYDPGHRRPPSPQQKHNRPDFDPGHRVPPEDLKETRQKRDDWVPGHRVPPSGLEQPEMNVNQALLRQIRELKDLIKTKANFITILETRNIQLQQQLQKLKKSQQSRQYSHHAPNPVNAVSPGCFPIKQQLPGHQQPSNKDISSLQQINKRLQFNLNNAQRQIQRLTHQNKILLTRNQTFVQANLPNYMKGYPLATAMENEEMAVVPVDGIQSSGQYSRNSRPDFIPSNINKEITQGTIKYAEKGKEEVEDNTTGKRPDWDPGHRVPPEQPQERPDEDGNKERRSDWDPGHRVPPEQPQERPDDENNKERRPDWDPGHRVPPEQLQERLNEERPLKDGAENPEDMQEAEAHQSQLSNFEAIQEQQHYNENTSKQNSSDAQIPHLIEELSQQKEPSRSQLQNSIHSIRERKRSATIQLQSDRELIKIEETKQNKGHVLQGYIHIKDDLQGSDQIELPSQVYDHYKIRQMIELTDRVRQKLTILRKQPENINMKEEIRVIIDEMEIIYSMLMICKKNTVSKLQKLITMESQKKNAEEENQRLKMKLQAANHLFSSITPISEGSGITFQEQLQEIMKNKTISEDNIYRRDTINSLELKPVSQKSHKELIEQGTQTEYFTGIMLESQVKRYLPGLRKMMTSESAINNSFLNKSFIDELGLITSDRMPYSQRMQRLQSLLQQFQDLDPINQTSPVRTNNKNEGSEEDLHRSRVRLDDEAKKIDSWISLNKDQIFNLHRLLKKTASLPPKFGEEFQLDSPIKRPILQNEKYIAVINNAPKKMKDSYNSSSEEKRQQQSREKKYLDEFKDMLKSRQNEFTTIISEKEQQIKRLIAIVEKLSQNPLREVKITPRASRIEGPNHQLQQMKSKVGDLELAFEKMKTENERLRLEVREAQLQQEIANMKTRQEKFGGPQSNIPEVNEATEQFLNIKAEGENLVTANEDEARTQWKAIDQEQPVVKIHSQIASEQGKKQTQEHRNQLQRRSFHYREGSPHSAGNIDTKWQDLMPEFFGKKKRGQH